MWFVLAFALGSCTLANAGTIAQSNHFVDDLFGSKLKGEAHAYNLNGVSIPDWTLEKIKSTGLTNRDIKGNFTNGYVRGLTDMKRSGDCSPTAWIGGNITLSCRIDINSVYAEWKLSVKGHTLSGNIKELPLKVQLKDTSALFEASAFPNRAVSLRTFYIEKMKFKLDYEDLGLNDERKKNLHDQAEKHASAEIFNVAYNTLSKAISSAMRGTTLPPV
ncbi:uncharacterized protein LOC111271170 [Varroa jacobsoni]|uniref:Uncharacterized protein n=1 Tax=Varroa destructor TaxID=109461 RepID=A0A7M7KRL1_VARDE|nr:uncharacterized protein LOC111253821 [Varroa destructor]XP_022707526.1 uncharacterized protein LOC111271170 [Varroa jacobsoni]